MPRKGTPTYILQSVAFPHTVDTFPSGVYEEIGIGLDAKGGGTWGEFTVQFYKFNSWTDHYAIKFDVFADGMNAFTDARIAPAIADITKLSNKDNSKEVTPQQVCDILDYHRIRQSHYMKGK